MASGMHIVQGNGQVYRIYTPQGIVVAELFMGQDGQIFKDTEALKAIAKIMAMRWNVNGKQ